jgi:phenylacetic acid degradation protein
MIFEYRGIKPVIHKSAFIHPQATVIGNVVIGESVYIGPHATLRGDFGEIIIEAGCNVQESCTLHMFPGLKVVLLEGAHIGHGAIIHGAVIGRNALIGMNAVVMDNVIVGADSIVGALSFVPEGMEIPDRKVFAGNPGKIVKDVSDEMLAWKTKGTEIYQSLPEILSATLMECEPLREMPPDRKPLPGDYQPWKKTKK